MDSKALGIALGTNLGDRIENLRLAVRQIKTFTQTPSILCSGVYETEPVDCPPGSEKFYNAVIEVCCELEALEVLDRCQAIERNMGRSQSRGTNAPRPIDLDLLYYGVGQYSVPRLVLPHPRLTTRRFVLRPLVEIRPDLSVPGETLVIEDILENLNTGEPEPELVFERDSWL